MNKLLTTVIISIILLSGCKTTSEDLTYVTKKEEIRKEAYTKLPDNELIAILKNESNLVKKENLPEKYLTFVSCKINGKECNSILIDIDKQKNTMIYPSPEVSKSFFPDEKLLVCQYENFYRIEYSYSEHFYEKRITTNYVQSFVIDKDKNTVFKTYSNNVIYLEGDWNNET